MAIRVVRRSISSPVIFGCLRRFLSDNVLASFASVNPRGTAHIHTAYFAWAQDWTLYYYSYPDSDHSRNLRSNPSMAVAVFDSRQTWGRPDRGVQLFGRCGEARGRLAAAAERCYASRFPAYVRWAETAREGEGALGLRPYRFRPRRAKLFDERVLGDGVFAEVRLP